MSEILSTIVSIACAMFLVWEANRWRRRALRAEAGEIAWKRQVFASIEDVAVICHRSLTACETVKAAIEGRRAIVTKAPDDMTLLEAQQHIDEILSPFWPNKVKA